MSIQLLFRTAVLSLMVATPFTFAQTAAQTANRPKLTGVWEMDTSKSHVVDGRILTLTIDQTPERLTMNEVIKTSSGSTKTMKFTCATDATDCDFDEGGHKSKIALWYNGEQLVACKTCGTTEDLVNEWHMRTSPDGNTLNIEVEHVDPVAAEELMVFTKQASTAKPNAANDTHKQ